MKAHVFLKIRFYWNFANYSGKHLRWETPSGLQPATLFKKRLQHNCFPVKLLRAPFSTEQLLSLLFKVSNSNTLFKDVSAISLTHSQSLITCNSHNNKLIWISIHLPKLVQIERFCNRFRTNSLLPETDLNINNFAVHSHFLIT